MAIVPSLVRDAWREARTAFYSNPTRHKKWMTTRRAFYHRASYNAANPGVTPYIGTFNVAERSRLNGEKRRAKSIRSGTMAGVDRIQAQRDTGTKDFRKTKKEIHEKMRDTRDTLIGIINTEIRAAGHRYDTTIASLRPWQFIKKRQARVQRDRDIRSAKWRSRRIPLFIKTVRERRKLRKDLRTEKRLYKADDKVLKERQELLKSRANTNFDRRMGTVRADRRTARYNTLQNLAHAGKKAWHNKSLVAALWRKPTGGIAGSVAAFRAASHEIGGRTFGYLGSRPALRSLWHTIQHAFS